MEFKDKLKDLRMGKGISQQQLADSIYVSRSAVAKWENGLGYPSEDSMESLCTYFAVDATYFLTEKPEAVIVNKNLFIHRILRFLFAGVLAALLLAALVVAGFWFGSASSADLDSLAREAEDYLDRQGLRVMQVDQRGEYLAALCRDEAGKWCLCVYERDALFRDRWVASGGKKNLKPNTLDSWNYGSPDKEAVLIFCGYDLSEDILFYSFSNAGIDYTCPVNEGMVLDIFIIVDTRNINGHPIALDGNKEPVN